MQPLNGQAQKFQKIQDLGPNIAVRHGTITIALLVPAPFPGSSQNALGGPQKVRRGPTTYSSRAFQTAFIAFSGPYVCNWPVIVPLAQCAAPYPPWLGRGGE